MALLCGVFLPAAGLFSLEVLLCEEAAPQYSCQLLAPVTYQPQQVMEVNSWADEVKGGGHSPNQPLHQASGSHLDEFPGVFRRLHFFFLNVKCPHIQSSSTHRTLNVFLTT